MNKETAIKILKDVQEHLGINTSELARSLGMDRAQGLYDVLNPNKNVGISKKLSDKIISTYPQFNITWLLTGEGEMLKDSQPAKAAEPAPSADLVAYLEKTINDKTKEIGDLKEEIGRLKTLLEQNNIDHNKAV